MAVTRLYRTVGFDELRRIQESGWTRLTQRLPEECFCYPILDEEYALQIARDSKENTYVLRFAVDAAFLARYPVQQVWNAPHREYWIPDEDLELLNDNIIGAIKLVASFSRYFDNVVKPQHDGISYECPCCRYPKLDERGKDDICSVCFWHDDGQDEHDANVVRGGPNKSLSLTHARINYEEFGASDRRRLEFVRPPTDAERIRRGSASS